MEPCKAEERRGRAGLCRCRRAGRQVRGRSCGDGICGFGARGRGEGGGCIVGRRSGGVGT